MATATVPQQFAVIPLSFTDALKQGWRITAESSRPSRGRRVGSVTLQKDDRQIAVGYFADADGYRFGSPQAL